MSNFLKNANLLIKRAGNTTTSALKKAGSSFKMPSSYGKELNSLQKQLNDKLLLLFVYEIEQCRKEYQSGKKTIIPQTEITSVAKKYGNKNLVISEGAGLVPGFFGMAAAIPEIIMIMKNQIDMVFDIGMACGQQQKMSREVVLYIFLSAMGIKNVAVGSVQGNKLIVKKSSQPALQEIICLIGLNVGRHLLKSLVAKWVPGIGGTAIALWSKYNTEQLAKRATELFKLDIELREELINTAEVAKVASATDLPTAAKSEQLKLQALGNLIKSDGKIEETEKEFLQLLTQQSSLSEADKKALSDSFAQPAPAKIELSAWQQHKDEAMALLIELISLARRDQQLHPQEEAYIRTLARQMKIESTEIDSLLKVKVNTDYTAAEKEYLEELQFCLEDKPEISSDERRLLERKRQKLGLSAERGQQLEAVLKKTELSGSEIEYINELKISHQGFEATALDALRTRLGISAERAKELEKLI